MNGRKARARRAVAAPGPGPDINPGPGRAAMRASIRANQRETTRLAALATLGRRPRAYLHHEESTASLLAARDRLLEDRTSRLLIAERQRQARINRALRDLAKAEAS